MRASPYLLVVLVLAGCVSRPVPATAPSTRTHTVIVAGGPTPTPTRPDSAQIANASSKALEAAIASAANVSSADIARLAKEVFGDSVSIVAPTALVTAAAGPSWDMDVRSYETQSRVAHYVAQFTGRSKDRLVERLERGTRFEPMIRAKMKAGGLPEDMYYLALVESGFDPHAYSRAAAVGMWQFMTSTARGMGLRVDWWVDERRDPIRSTTAAVRFLRGLRNQFGSLYLAAAAYNGGPGRVSRGLAMYAGDLENTQGEDAFFVLAEKDYLRNETREYVPQLIAAALIAKEPVRYGMELRPRAPFAYDSSRVPASTPLAAVAKAARVTVREVADLNSHLLRGMTPPGESYPIRLPVGAGIGFDSAFAVLSKDERTATHSVRTKKGETAERLAHEHGVPARTIEGFNPSMRRVKSGRLAPGQLLVIPTPAVASAALNIPDPAIERFTRSTSKLKVHTVKRGETLGAIARRHSTSTERLMRVNGMRRPVIFVGQTLVLAASSSSRTKVSRPAGVGRATRAVAKSSRPSSASSAKGVARKRSGADSKVGARTKSKSVKRASQTRRTK